MSKKKKIIVLTSMIALLVLTGFLNVALNNNLTGNVSGSITNESFFVGYSKIREESRNKEISLYNSIISSTTASAESKAAAEQLKQKLIVQMAKEVAIEGLIRSKGFSNAMFTQNDSYINVVVGTREELTRDQVTQITKIIVDQTGYPIDNITIIPSIEK